MVRCNFYKWYSQALGATLGIIACIFGYLNGYMFVYTNIENNFDYLGFDGIISSYLLLPMCILTLLFSIMRIYYEQNTFFSIPFRNVNDFIIIFTIILGFLGTKMYFTIPCIIIIIGYISFSKLTNNINKNSSLRENTNTDTSHINVNKEAYSITNQNKLNTTNDFDNKNTNVYYNKESYTSKNYEYSLNKESKLLITRQTIALSLIEKNASIEFIKEITGFTAKEIEEIKNTYQGYID